MNPFREILKGLKFAGGKAIQGAAFASMLSDMGIPIPFIQYMKLGMTIAELSKNRSSDKAIIAKDAAMNLAREHGVDMSKVSDEAIDMLLQLLLSPATNGTPQLAFDVERAAALLRDVDVDSVKAIRAMRSERSLNPSVASARSVTRQEVNDAIRIVSKPSRPRDILIRR